MTAESSNHRCRDAIFRSFTSPSSPLFHTTGQTSSALDGSTSLPTALPARRRLPSARTDATATADEPVLAGRSQSRRYALARTRVSLGHADPSSERSRTAIELHDGRGPDSNEAPGGRGECVTNKPGANAVRRRRAFPAPRLGRSRDRSRRRRRARLCSVSLPPHPACPRPHLTEGPRPPTDTSSSSDSTPSPSARTSSPQQACTSNGCTSTSKGPHRARISTPLSAPSPAEPVGETSLLLVRASEKAAGARERGTRTT